MGYKPSHPVMTTHRVSLCPGVFSPGESLLPPKPQMGPKKGATKLGTGWIVEEDSVTLRHAVGVYSTPNRM